MLGEMKNVYGPYTWTCGPFGIFTPLILWFVRTVYIHETPDGIAVYKVLRGDVYILGAGRKQSQAERAGLS